MKTRLYKRKQRKTRGKPGRRTGRRTYRRRGGSGTLGETHSARSFDYMTDPVQTDPVKT